MNLKLLTTSNIIANHHSEQSPVIHEIVSLNVYIMQLFFKIILFIT